MNKISRKIAVVGTGPAGFGVLTALLEQQENYEITVFEIGNGIKKIPFNAEVTKENVREYYDAIYKEIREKFGFKFPPPKTHFAESIPKYLINGEPKIFHSQFFGGLSNFWGGGSLPFTDVEFQRWPIRRKDIDPYYEKLAKIIGISGRRDALNEYFGEDFVNLPPMYLTEVTKRLDKVINLPVKSPGRYKVYSGINRCAVETRKEKTNCCKTCGECLAGCFTDAIYSTNYTIQKYLKDFRVKTVLGKVIKVDSNGGKLWVKKNDKIEEYTGFSKIYLAAGCPNTTEIVMRSTGISEVELMADNAVYVFPIIYFGLVSPKYFNEPYLSLCNLIWAVVPDNKDLYMAQVSIYTNFDYMWRYNIPNGLWKWLFRPLVAISRNHIFWARLFVHGNDSQAYSIRLIDDELKFDYARYASNNCISEMMKSLGKAVNRNGFYIPPIPALLQKANSHYAATLPVDGKFLNVSKNGQIMSNVYICDSSIFPELPAVSLTFTIMANACRIATETV